MMIDTDSPEFAEAVMQAVRDRLSIFIFLGKNHREETEIRVELRDKNVEFASDSDIE